MLKSFQFECRACDIAVDDLIESRDFPDGIPEGTPHPEDRRCERCGGALVRALTAPYYGRMNDPAVRDETLRKRSEAHSAKLLKQEGEKFGIKQVQSPWNARKR